MARISIDNYGKNLSRILADAKKIKKLSTFLYLLHLAEILCDVLGKQIK